MRRTVRRRKPGFLAGVVLIVSWLSGIVVNGQRIVPSPEDMFVEAAEYMIAEEYQEALPVLLDLQKKGFSGANITYRIGECYVNLKGQKTKAIPFLKEATKKISRSYSGNDLAEDTAPARSLLLLGIAYRVLYDFDNAVRSFTAYLEALDETDTDNRAVAKFHIERCMNARELIASPAKIYPDTLPDLINTEFSNYNPVVTHDEKQLFYMDQLKFYDALMRSVKPDTAWQAPVNLTPRIKSDGDHVLTGLSSDGRIMLLNAYDPYMSGDIFITEYIGGEWSGIQKLNGNINTRFNETHASFSPDGQTILFTSDRRGGSGGLDIYRSVKKEEGDWGVAENLGPVINSPLNEESPFMTGDGKTLFFSSQGHYNMGGYDIFMSSLNDSGTWLSPVNPGYPLNTTDDDVFFFPLDSGTTGYAARMTANSARQDIIRYRIAAFGNPARFRVSGTIKQQPGTEQESEDLTVFFVDNSTLDTVSSGKVSPEGAFDGKLSAGNFTVGFRGNDSVYLRRKLDIPVNFPQELLVMNAELTVNRPVTKEIFRIQDIRFGFDKCGLDGETTEYLDEVAAFMEANSGVHLGVSGYADSHGGRDYNMKLSRLRAEAVASYLNCDNRFWGRITVKGFGEENPVALNWNSDGRDNPRGRLYNRRVELEFDAVPQKVVLSPVDDIPVELRIR